jgi:hypothetical protein
MSRRGHVDTTVRLQTKMRKLSLSEWASIAEIVGAIAVVLSLLYLSAQVRNQNVETRFAAMHEIAVGLREAYAVFANPEIAELLLEDYDRLDDAEKLVLITLWTNVFRVWEEAFIQNLEGRLVGRHWEAIVPQIKTIFSVPSVPKIWSLRKHYYDTEFREFIENLKAGEWKLN